MAFVQNAAGFFIQLLPCAIMVFLPFPREDCRFRRGVIFSCMTIAVFIVSMLFALVICSGISSNTALAANIYMFSTIFLIMAAYISLVRDALTKKLLVFLVVMFYAVFQYCLVNALNGSLAVLFNIAPEHNESAVYSAHGIMMYMITNLLLLPPMLLFVIRMLREYIQEVETQNMRREFYVLAVSTVIFIAMMICVDFTYYYLDSKSYLLLLAMLLILLMYQILIYRFIFRESVRRKRDGERRRMEGIRRMQYEKIAGDIENARRMRHDVRHHYNTLNDMLDRGMLKEMKDYLSEVIDTTVKHDNEVYCGNMTVNGLLQYYIGLAREKNISCQVRAECGELNIDPVDLTVLFGNAMENAINACMRFKENRWINIQIGTVQRSLAIEISNPCMEVRVSRYFQNKSGFLPAEAFLSGNPEGGRGLRSIAQTARKYDGSDNFRFDAEKKIFTARIRLNTCANT